MFVLFTGSTVVKFSCFADLCSYVAFAELAGEPTLAQWVYGHGGRMYNAVEELREAEWSRIQRDLC